MSLTIEDLIGTIVTPTDIPAFRVEPNSFYLIGLDSGRSVALLDSSANPRQLRAACNVLTVVAELGMTVIFAGTMQSCVYAYQL